MRVLYYSSSIQWEPILALIPEMSRRVEFHLLLEISPEAWSSALFDVPRMSLQSGIVAGDPVLRDSFPARVRAHWQQSASFNLIVHDCPRSLHPRTLWTSHKAARFVDSMKPDIIHLDNVSLRMAPAMWELRGTPILLTLHDPEPHSGEDNWRVRLGRRLTFPLVRRYLLYNRASRQSFCTHLGIPSDRVDSLLLGVHGMCKEWMREPVPADDRTVLFFGRLSQYKGLEVLYEAALRVAQSVPNVRFIVAGRPALGYAPPAPPKLARGGTVEVIERYLRNAETAELFARSTVVACPYIDATQSGVVLTAYAFGKPVVATRVGGLPEYVEDGVTGILVRPGDAGALAAALIRLLQDPASRERIRENIESRAETALSWRSVVEQMVAVYQRTIEQ